MRNFIILVVLIVIAGILFLRFDLGIFGKKSTQNASAVSTYFCDQGELKATFAGDSVAIQLPDGHTATLKQSNAASGMRYEGEQMTFVGKGANANLTQGTTTTFTNCVMGTLARAGDMNTFTSDGNTFSFSYPASWTLSGGDIGYTQSWRLNAMSQGLLLAKAMVPASVQPKTNFGSATLTIGLSSDPAATSNCTTAASGEQALSPATFGGATFSAFSSSDVGAGNLTETTSYRAMYEGSCYALEYTIRSLNLGNFSPDQGISAFNKAAIHDALDKAVQSFRFGK
jgi:membrane-bound inhibitor of C-type lysozyme